MRLQREPPGGFESLRANQAELDRVFGRSEMVNWLLADWYSDEKDDPCERFVVYRMLPAQYVHPDVREALNGPAPETLGYWAERRASFQTVAPGCHPLPVKRWVSTGTPGVTQRAWELWKEHHAWAQLFWIVQGSNGGHKYKIKSVYEQKARRMCGLPPDTPHIGALPYAPFDSRVIDQLVSLDEERKQVRMLTNLMARTVDTTTLEEEAEARTLRRQLAKWWSDQVDEAVDEAGMVGRGGYWARTRLDAPYKPEQKKDMDVETEAFVNDGLLVSA